MKPALKWLKNPENVSYADGNVFFDNFEKETGITELREKVIAFAENPTVEGLVLRGNRRTCITVFVPNVSFEEHIDMGENPWIFMGNSMPAWCIYNLTDYWGKE